MAQFRIMTADGPMAVDGRAYNLDVGGKQMPFIVHNDTLSCRRSGYKVGNINEVKIAHMMARGSHVRTSDRDAAQGLIDRTIARLGLEKVITTLANAPALPEDM